MKTLTVDDKTIVLTLKVLGRTVPVRSIADFLGATTRQVATAARKPAKDGRIRITFPKRGAAARYRFVRMTPKAGAK